MARAEWSRNQGDRTHWLCQSLLLLLFSLYSLFLSSITRFYLGSCTLPFISPSSCKAENCFRNPYEKFMYEHKPGNTIIDLFLTEGKTVVFIVQK